MSEKGDAARKLGQEKRAEAKRELHRLFQIPEECNSQLIDRVVDLIVDAAVLETASVYDEAAERKQ